MKTNQFQEKYNFLRKHPTFALASEITINKLAEKSCEMILEQGQTLLRDGIIEKKGFIVIEGTVRLLAKNPITNELFTVGKAGKGDVIGIIDLLRHSPCEIAIARQKSTFLSIDLEELVSIYQNDEGIRNGLDKLTSPSEKILVLSKIGISLNPPPEDIQTWLLEQLKHTTNETKETIYLLSTEIKGEESLVASEVNRKEVERLQNKNIFTTRYIKWNNHYEEEKHQKTSKNSATKENSDTQKQIWYPSEKLDLEKVGIRDSNKSSDLQGFKPIKGEGAVGANLATLKMISRAYETPCPVDILEKMLEGAAERAASIPIHGMGQLAETMGLQTQVGIVNIDQLDKLELPVVISRKTYYALVTEVKNKKLLLADPTKGWVSLTIEEAKKEWGNNVQVLLLKRLLDTPKRQFGWDWFTPVLKKYQWSLVQVLLASLFIQLFQLANPLLLQQIIDKVINQSNLSALQVLGGALVAAALFQGLLTAVRTWLLIDTTDRMDLLLGSQVIDKLLRLPLRFFEKRPVGELSQRLSELGNLRGFLTGTAITSALDLLFATIYILIMIIYSPILTVVALSTVPIYVLLILIVAPLYRRLIRKQAQFAAKTQSHLIETLGGIQTVKAQHFELNSRWKWQERYSGQIAEGFKSVVLGSSISEIGNFLNQLSSLLIIWVGVYQVVNGELSLGQLIAFRIIAGYVTGPILRLSGLWQGFQQVGISMERLADIVDQTPEAGQNEVDQISLPPIKGKVEFKDLIFRFERSGPYQLDNVNLSIEEGSFIGIVGQSGSGKSTLMKLLPRLYNPKEGRILIDGYDISKVNLSSVRQQIGIVPQDCLLFEGTIRENITMNHPEADTEEVIRVARASEAHDFIMELTDGYGTRLGERGAGLSGGQKQRIAIARTLLQNPSLLILDEATSALDYDTESTVCKNLQKELQNKTVFFITHRLSTVRHADKIILMHQGKISEEGTHKELIEMGGRYATLYAHQGDA